MNNSFVSKDVAVEVAVVFAKVKVNKKACAAQLAERRTRFVVS